MKKLIIMLVCIIAVTFLMSSCTTEPIMTKNYTTYECDVKVTSFNTEIEIEKNGEYFGQIYGDVWKFVEDPLTMEDETGEKIAYAGDAYHFINQDSHGIYVNDTFMYDMYGLFKWPGESYEIYDKDENLVATVTFNAKNTRGKMIDTNKKLIAEYVSDYSRRDYKVIISDDCEIDHISVLIICASYYSDYKHDS